MPTVLTVAALAIIASFILESAAGAPSYAYAVSAVAAVLVLVALFLHSRPPDDCRHQAAMTAGTAAHPEGLPTVPASAKQRTT